MNILFFENEGSWRGQCLLKLNSRNNHKIDVLSDVQLSIPLEEQAQNFASEFPFVDLFFININILAGGLSRCECAGINLLKLIRLCHLDKHCVLYSFLNREQLMQLSIDNLIIFSEGVTFVQLPSDVSKLEIEKLAKQKASSDLSKYLKAESRIPDDRHFFANWWGALQLWKIHQILHSQNKDTLKSIQHQLFNAAKGIGTYQGLLAQYLYGQGFQKLSADYIESKKELHNHFQRYSAPPDSYNEQLIDLDKKIERAASEQFRLNDILHEIESSDNLQQFFLWLSGKPKEIKDKIKNWEIGQKWAKEEHDEIQRYQQLKTYLEEEKYKIQFENDFLISERAKTIGEYQNAVLNLENSNTFNEVLKEKSPKILYIDDQAEEGWGSIFQLMIYGKEKPEEFRIIKPEKTSEIELVILKCFELIHEFEPDLIILDLRLFGETGTISDANELSGFKVLKAFKSGFKQSQHYIYSPVSCPIMIVTASNKVFTYQAINDMGADAYWIKEGLDNKLSIDESIKNYWDFLGKVYLLCYSNEFRFIRKMKKDISELKTVKDFWWQSKERFRFNLTPGASLNSVSKIDVLNILDDSLFLTENFMQSILMKNLSIKIGKSLPSLIAINLFQIIENIHEEITTNNIYTVLNSRIKEHHKNIDHNKLDELVKLRNDAVHHNSLTINDLQTFFQFLKEYLMIIPQEKISSTNKIGLVSTSNQFEKNNPRKVETKTYSAPISHVDRRNGYFSISRQNLKSLSLDKDITCFEMQIIEAGGRKFSWVTFEIKKDAAGGLIATNVSLNTLKS